MGSPQGRSLLKVQGSCQLVLWVAVVSQQPMELNMNLRYNSRLSFGDFITVRVSSSLYTTRYLLVGGAGRRAYSYRLRTRIRFGGSNRSSPNSVKFGLQFRHE